MARARRPVGVLILLDMDKMTVEIGDQYRQRGSVGVMLVTRALDCVGRVNAAIDNRQIRLLAGR